MAKRQGVWYDGAEEEASDSHVILRCLRQRVGDGYNDTDERKVVSYVKREFESNSEGKGLVTGGAGRQGERGAADYFKMGAGSFPNKRILETIHETPACVKGITIEYYIF